MQSIALRMFLAVLCGGLIGLERESKRRPAGFRTHILICLGACMTTLTGQYLSVYMHYYTDMARLGAQVIAGIGFIGAGTIIVTKRRQVRGLTTAAGLWTAAIVGLACGAGYYEGVISGTALVLLAEMVFSRLEYWLTANAREINLYIKYAKPDGIDRTVRYLHEHRVKILDLEIVRGDRTIEDGLYAIILLRPVRRVDQSEIEAMLARIEDVFFVERL